MKRGDWGFLFMAIAACVVMLLSSIHARADAWLTTSMWSYHADRNANYRERNNGFGLEYELTPSNSIIIGEYMNSINRHSNYAGFAMQPWHAGAFKFGVSATVVTGYNTSSGYAIVPVPAITYTGERTGVNITAIPNKLIAVQFKWRL